MRSAGWLSGSSSPGGEFRRLRRGPGRPSSAGFAGEPGHGDRSKAHIGERGGVGHRGYSPRALLYGEIISPVLYSCGEGSRPVELAELLEVVALDAVYWTQIGRASVHSPSGPKLTLPTIVLKLWVCMYCASFLRRGSWWPRSRRRGSAFGIGERRQKIAERIDPFGRRLAWYCFRKSLMPGNSIVGPAPTARH